MVLFWWRNKNKKEKRKNNAQNKNVKNPKPITTTTNHDMEIPSHFLCPISLDLMRDPVTLSSGITFDRSSIDTWLHSSPATCPVTNTPLSGDPIPNHALGALIHQWCTEHRCTAPHPIPTPLSPTAAAKTLSLLATSAETLHARACARHVARVIRWARESDRDRLCLARCGAAGALARALGAFSHSERAEVCCGEILSALSLMLPLADVTKEILLSSERSLRCMVSFLRCGNDDMKRSSAAVLEELVSGSYGDDRREILEFLSNMGLVEVLMGFLVVRLGQSQTCPKLAKHSLMLIFHFFSSETSDDFPSLEKVRSEFLEKGLVGLLLDVLVEVSQKGDNNNSTVICERALGVMDGLCGTQEGRELALDNDLTIPVLVKKILRVSALATEFSVSAIWKLIFKSTENDEDKDGHLRSAIVGEVLQVGAFQKLLVTIQLGCGDETKVKVSELLKLLNPYRPQLECIETVDFKSLKRSF